MFHFSKKSIRVNEEQATAICRPPSSHQRILASAGSGKTTTLTARIAYLIEEHGVPPETIVLMTFSRNAAGQMKQRIESLIGKTKLWVGTFHALCKGLLRENAAEKLKNLYFVDELIGMGEEWLITEKGREWVGKLRYVVVDEFQDINESQWRILQRMLHPHARLIIVGDDCQNIYTWRGSNVKYILELHKQIRGLIDDNLRRNYRSCDSIVRCANAVMKKIPTLEGKGAMIAEKKGGEKPHVRFFYRLADETKWILESVKEARPGATIAVLSRTNSDLYRLEEEMIKQGFHCRLRDIGIDEETGGEGITINLVTLHAAKGLEWDIVYMVNCNDDVFPSSKRADQIICERRLFYVGVTRAREVLHLSYTRDERALCRFIREIPSQFLTYHGLARYCLSDVEITEGKKRLRDIIGGLDGDALHELREEGILTWLSRDNMSSDSIFKPGEVWKLPAWAVGEHASDFQRFLRIWILRQIAVATGTPFRECGVERMLFTLRVYSEDREFWTEWSHEIMDCIHTFLGGVENQKAPPSVDYGTMNQWAQDNKLPWGPKELIRATSIVAKIRGQLRPLRFDAYSLDEFRLAPSRYVVPTEWRGDVLRSWRRVSKMDLSWKECLLDIWKLGAMSLVSEGRNSALYRTQSMAEKLSEDGLNEYLECLELRLSEWLQKIPIEGISSQVHYETEETQFTEVVDLHTENCFWKIGGTERIDTQEIVELAMLGYFSNAEITSVGIFLPLEGRFYTVRLPAAWCETGAARLLERALNVVTSS